MSLVPVGDGHHESALADDKDQAQDTTVVAAGCAVTWWQTILLVLGIAGGGVALAVMFP